MLGEVSSCALPFTLAGSACICSLSSCGGVESGSVTEHDAGFTSEQLASSLERMLEKSGLKISPAEAERTVFRCTTSELPHVLELAFASAGLTEQTELERRRIVTQSRENGTVEHLLMGVHTGKEEPVFFPKAVQLARVLEEVLHRHKLQVTSIKGGGISSIFKKKEKKVTKLSMVESTVDEGTLSIIKGLQNPQIIPIHEIQKVSSIGVSKWRGVWSNGSDTSVVIRELARDIPGSRLHNLVQARIDLQHENIVKFYGVVCVSPMLLVTEYFSNGSLVDYLKDGEGKNSNLSDLIRLGAQISAGIEFISGKSYVHTALHQGSVFVAPGGVCKITNLTMILPLRHGGSIYRVRTGWAFPIKWTALEAVLYGVFSLKSDVWSFGVILHQILERGRIPYSGMLSREMLQKLEQGYRMPKPDGCPDNLYELIRGCWEKDTVLRPSIKYIHEFLENYTVDSVYLPEMPSECLCLQQSSSAWEALTNLWLGHLDDGYAKIPVTIRRAVLGEVLPREDSFQGFMRDKHVLGKLRHVNIVRLLGYVPTDISDCYTIMPEAMTLKQFLVEKGSSCEHGSLVRMGLQIATGMDYIGKQKYVHGNLQARIVHLEGGTCKITDFTQAVQVEENEQHAPKTLYHVPVKWLAIETLASGILSVKSDVWSFAITLVEILTNGENPYPGILESEIKGKLDSGYRMERPKQCPEKLFEMISACWEEDKTKRPSFEWIQKFLNDYLAAEGVEAVSAVDATENDVPVQAEEPHKDDKSKPRARALYDFNKTANDEISFSVGDIITDVETILQPADEGWWRGTCHGARGLFPANHVELEKTDVVPDKTGK